MKAELLLKILFALTFLLGGNLVYAQKKEVRYYDADEIPTKESKAYYFGIVEVNPESSPAGAVSFYTLDSVLIKRREYRNVSDKRANVEPHGISTYWYKNGQKQAVAEYVKGQKHGSYQEWYENGNLKYTMTFEKGQLRDTLYGYYESGKMRRTDIFKAGELVKGSVFSEEGIALPYVRHFELPEYFGGDDIMLKYLGTHVRYPAEAQRNGASGLVVIGFKVSPDGSLKDFTVRKSAGPMLDEEALRVVRGMPNWLPGQKEGVAEEMTAFVPVRFSIR
ncbi:TonB family protein [Pontibacter sp. HJ8]